MKKLIKIQALYATSLLAISLASVGAQAALTKVTAAQPKTEQAIVEDAITPEASADADADEEVVVVKKSKAKTVVKKSTVTREQTEITPPDSDAQQPVVVVPPPAAKPTTGQQLDAGVKAKMEDVQNQFEQALLKSLDRIKISVDDGAPPQGSSTPTQSAVVQDNLVGNAGAANKSDYMSVDAAPVVADDEADSDGQSVAALPKEEKKSDRKVRFAPVFGKTNINSSAYNVSSRYTAGFELEMDIENNFALVLGYSYSQYDISLATSSPFVNYYQPYGGFGGNTNSLGYNQNLFEGGMRIYLMPKEAKFRIFGGAGVGYNLGYLNYNTQNQASSYQYNPYNTGTTDYEVKAWMGLLSAGGAFNISENVSLGAIFKYALVFSASENTPINNYAFVNNVNSNQSHDQAVVGGSLAKDNFYSILGTVKVAF